MKKEFTVLLNSNKAVLWGIVGFIIGWCIIIPIVFLYKSGTPQAFAVGFYVSLLFLLMIIFVYAFVHHTKFTLTDDCVLIERKCNKQQIYYNDIDNFNLLMGYILRINIFGKKHFYYFTTMTDRKVEQKKCIREIVDILQQKSLKKTLLVDRFIYVFCCSIFPIVLCVIVSFFD